MNNIKQQLEKLPEFLTSNDLVDLGLFVSPDAAYFARRGGQSPDFIKLGRKIVYPKYAVISFLDERMRSGTAVCASREYSKKDKEKSVSSLPLNTPNRVNIDYEKLDKMPDLLIAGDLIAIGIYSNHDHVRQNRVKGYGPKYVTMGNRIFYKKEDVLKFITAE